MDFWEDNPFSQAAKELSGQGTSTFSKSLNPFATVKDVLEKTGLNNNHMVMGALNKADESWRTTQGKATAALHSNINNTAGYVSGANATRQQEWEKQVKDEAQAAQTKIFNNNLQNLQNKDLAGSRAASLRLSVSQKSGNTFYNPSNSDQTDFLGL